MNEPTAPAELPFPVAAEVDLDPVWLGAFAAAEADLATGRTTFFGSAEEFDAYARQLVADDGEHLTPQRLAGYSSGYAAGRAHLRAD
jgi:hypothetical protein